MGAPCETHAVEGPIAVLGGESPAAIGRDPSPESARATRTIVVKMAKFITHRVSARTPSAFAGFSARTPSALAETHRVFDSSQVLPPRKDPNHSSTARHKREVLVSYYVW
jgi:hypothetical protein